MAYFTYFPVMSYDVRGTKNNRNIQYITNILTRVRKKLEIVNHAYFEQYFVRDGDTPESLAHQVYNDSELHWIIMYGNYMTNPYYDWPLGYRDLVKFVTKKYADINGVHHYEDADKYEVDSTASGATAITNFVYEETLNDAKRQINIIKSEYTQLIVSEFKKIIVE